MQRMTRIQQAAPVPGTRKACEKVQRWARAATCMHYVGLLTCLSLVCYSVINLVPSMWSVKYSRWGDGRMGGMRRKEKKGKRREDKRADGEGGEL